MQPTMHRVKAPTQPLAVIDVQEVKTIQVAVIIRLFQTQYTREQLARTVVGPGKSFLRAADLQSLRATLV